MVETYIDLFDDALYRWPSEAESNYASLKNHLRVLVFTNLLLGRPIIVPEQWAVSSAACIDVLAEVAAGYCHYQAGRLANRTSAALPIHFACFDRTSEVVGQVRSGFELPAALLERTLVGRRLRLSERIDAGAGRDDLRALIAACVEEDRPDPFGVNFQLRLEDILYDGARAGGLSALFGYARQGATVRRAVGGSYANHLATYFNSVRSVVARPDSEVGDPAPYLDLFDRVDKAGVPHHEYVRMLPAIADGDPEARATMEHVFRSGMHIGLASTVGAGMAALSYGCYEAARPAAGAEALSVAAAKYGSGASAPFGLEAEAYEVLTSRAVLAPVDKGDDRWERAWSQMFATMTSTEFIKLRGRVLTAADQVTEKNVSRRSQAVLDDFVGFCIKEFEVFEFRNAPENRVAISVGRKHAGVQIALSTVGAIAGATALLTSNSDPERIGAVITLLAGLGGGAAVAVEKRLPDAAAGRIRQLLRKQA